MPNGQEWQDTGYQPKLDRHEDAMDDSNDRGYQLRTDDTWQADPFEDGAEDPKLRQARSDNLNYHQGEFWEDPQQGGGTQGAGPEQAQQAPRQANMAAGSASQPAQRADGGAAKGKRRVGRRASAKAKKTQSINQRIIRRMLTGLAVLAVLALLVVAVVFRVQAVQVVGNDRIAASTVAQLSGLQDGYHNLLLVNDEAVSKAVEQNRYLRVVSVQKLFPATVILHVRERSQSAYIRYAGILYVLDSRGVVLEESSDTSVQPALMRLEGLEIANEPILGRSISAKKQDQLNTYISMMMELKALKMTERVTEFYLGDANNLYLATDDGYSVRLGSSERLHAKLRAMMLVRDELRSRGLTDGTIDVATPEQPTYIP